MTEIDVTKYFKIHRDEYSRIFAIETVGDERELIKEIRKQNEQLHRYKQVIEEIERISKEAGNTEYLTFPDFDLKINAKMLMGQFNGYLKQIIQKCEEVND